MSAKCHGPGGLQRSREVGSPSEQLQPIPHPCWGRLGGRKGHSSIPESLCCAPESLSHTCSPPCSQAGSSPVPGHGSSPMSWEKSNQDSGRLAFQPRFCCQCGWVLCGGWVTRLHLNPQLPHYSFGTWASHFTFIFI